MRRTLAGAVSLARRAARLGATPLDRARLRVVAVALVAAERLPVVRDRGLPIRVAAPGGPARVHVRQRTDLLVLLEVLVEDAYALPPDLEPRVVVDAGANIGAAALAFGRRFPQAVVHAFEPDPAARRLLRRNTASLGNVVVHPAAIGGRDGTALFFPARESFKSSLAPSSADAVGVEVPVRTLDGVVSELGPVDVVKLDVEGAELEVLRAARRLGQVEIVLAEVHGDLLPAGGAEAVVALLEEDFEVQVTPMPMPALPGADRSAVAARRRR